MIKAGVLQAGQFELLTLIDLNLSICKISVAKMTVFSLNYSSSFVQARLGSEGCFYLVI